MYFHCVFVLLTFFSPAFAIPLSAVSDAGVQTRPIEHMHIALTFPRKSIGNPEVLTEGSVCKLAVTTLNLAKLVLPELGLPISCGDYPGAELPPKRKPSEIFFDITVPARLNNPSAFCNPKCTAIFKKNKLTLSGRSTIYNGKKIVHMTIVGLQSEAIGGKSFFDLIFPETKLGFSGLETVSAPQTGTHIQYNALGKIGMKKEEVQKEVEKLFDYTAPSLGMKTPLTFTFCKHTQGSTFDLSITPNANILFTFVSSPGLDFCRSGCQGVIWEHKEGYILGPRTVHEGKVIERLIAFGPSTQPVVQLEEQTDGN